MFKEITARTDDNRRFFGAWASCKIQTEILISSFSAKLVQMMVKREKNIMNNHVFLAAILLDPRFNVILSEEQSYIAIKHLKNVWVYLKQIESERMQSSSTINIDEQKTLNNLIDSDELEIYLRNKDHSS